MAWRRLTEGDLAPYLSQREVEAYRRSADYTADAVASILAAGFTILRIVKKENSDEKDKSSRS